MLALDIERIAQSPLQFYAVGSPHRVSRARSIYATNERKPNRQQIEPLKRISAPAPTAYTGGLLIACPLMATGS
jgi:hypothetical protein